MTLKLAKEERWGLNRSTCGPKLKTFDAFWRVETSGMPKATLCVPAQHPNAALI